MRVLDGKATAKLVETEVAREVAAWVGAGRRRPALATVLVGAHEDSRRYVRTKHAACARVGVDASESLELPASVSMERLLGEIRRLNAAPNVDGVLVQLPLPAHLDQEVALREVSADKDVDGFHPLNVGLLARYGDESRRRARAGQEPLKPLARVPCTPTGVIELLDRHGVPLAGKRAVVLGRSNVVGLPMALLLTHRDATTTVVHSRSGESAARALAREADVLVCAMGRPRAVDASWVKPGAAVVDVGISLVDGKLAGDVDFDDAARVAGFLTPVPGGVGPMTVAVLLRNTVRSARSRGGDDDAD